jgi:SAM-dependent methyltransferase
MRPGRAAAGAVLRVAPGLAPGAQRVVFKLIYDLASRGSRGAKSSFMNYGYAGDDEGDAVSGREDSDRFGRQLYERVAGAAELFDKDVLEVGCGRGGGTAFVAERFRPRTMTGVDFAASAIARSRAEHMQAGLTFVTGDAEALPFAEGSFDAVLSVESSHCYPSVPRFLAEVSRVLRPGGLLLLADFRHSTLPPEAETALFEQEDVACLRHQIVDAGFRILDEEDITANVLRALRLDSPNRRAQLESRTPKLLRRHALAFAAVDGGAMYRAYEEGLWTYLRFALQKP